MTSEGESEGQLGRAEVPLVPVADEFEAPRLRELESAPDVPAEAREELLALKSGAAFVCARREGDIRPARASGEGLYVEDTRHLSELRLTVGGLPPVPLSSVMESGHYAVINATNPGVALGGRCPGAAGDAERAADGVDRMIGCSTGCGCVTSTSSRS